jgi:hypothetical protein
MLADDRFSSAMLGTTMPPLRNPDVADKAPNDPTLTVYDEEHAVTYMRLLDAEAEGADWQEVCRIAYTSIRSTTRTVPAAPSIATSPGPNGQRGLGIGSCLSVGGRAAHRSRLLLPPMAKLCQPLGKQCDDDCRGQW